MPEDYNAEIAHNLVESEHRPAPEPGRRRHEAVEIVEAILLAIVAIATAWSGYQAARWEGEESKQYTESTRYRVEAATAEGLGGQVLQVDVSTLNTWITADAAGHDKVARLYLRRFTPSYKVAFDAWLETDPLHDPDAPPGPSFMPEYHNPQLEKAERLNELANGHFDEASHGREIADEYVRTTVVLATVLFLIAMSQRFRIRGVRIALVVVGLGLLGAALLSLSTYPRL